MNTENIFRHCRACPAIPWAGDAESSSATAFLVKEKISPRGMEAKQYAIEQGYLVEENHQEWRKMNQKPPLMKEKLR